MGLGLGLPGLTGNLTSDSRKQNVSNGAAWGQRASTGTQPSAASRAHSKSRLGCGICLRLCISWRAGTAPPAFSHMPLALLDAVHAWQRRNAKEVGPRAPGTPPVRPSARGFQQEASSLENCSGSSSTFRF